MIWDLAAGGWVMWDLVVFIGVMGSNQLYPPPLVLYYFVCIFFDLIVPAIAILI